ncbi:MAG TPA: flavoprotein, partial [Ferruginibacter sp.]|nr:flavoprotein [Ferruginibacter sp.]
MKKIVVAVTGASGSIYSRILLNKLILLKDQWDELSLVMTENAKEVWKIELDDEDYKGMPVKSY